MAVAGNKQRQACICKTSMEAPPPPPILSSLPPSSSPSSPPPSALLAGDGPDRFTLPSLRVSEGSSSTVYSTKSTGRYFFLLTPEKWLQPSSFLSPWIWLDLTFPVARCSAYRETSLMNQRVTVLCSYGHFSPSSMRSFSELNGTLREGFISLFLKLLLVVYFITCLSRTEQPHLKFEAVYYRDTLERCILRNCNG